MHRLLALSLTHTPPPSTQPTHTPQAAFLRLSAPIPHPPPRRPQVLNCSLYGRCRARLQRPVGSPSGSSLTACRITFRTPYSSGWHEHPPWMLSGLGDRHRGHGSYSSWCRWRSRNGDWPRQAASSSAVQADEALSAPLPFPADYTCSSLHDLFGVSGVGHAQRSPGSWWRRGVLPRSGWGSSEPSRGPCHRTGLDGSRSRPLLAHDCASTAAEKFGNPLAERWPPEP